MPWCPLRPMVSTGGGGGTFNTAAVSCTTIKAGMHTTKREADGGRGRLGWG